MYIDADFIIKAASSIERTGALVRRPAAQGAGEQQEAERVHQRHAVRADLIRLSGSVGRFFLQSGLSVGAGCNRHARMHWRGWDKHLNKAPTRISRGLRCVMAGTKDETQEEAYRERWT